MADQYGLADRTFDEAHRRAARPTMHRFDDHVYIVAFSGSLAEIDMYLGPDVVDHGAPPRSRRSRVGPAAGARAVQAARRTPTTTSGQMFATLLDELIDGYFDTTDVLEDKLEVDRGQHLQRRRTASSRDCSTICSSLRRELLELRRAVVPLREVLSAILRREVQWIDGDALVTCRDAFDKLLRAVDLVDEQRELVGNAVDAHLAVMSNQMNFVMKKLTAWGSIVFGATLIAGIYGMNFQHMPELGWQYGYPVSLGHDAACSASCSTACSASVTGCELRPQPQRIVHVVAQQVDRRAIAFDLQRVERAAVPQREVEVAGRARDDAVGIGGAALRLRHLAADRHGPSLLGVVGRDLQAVRRVGAQRGSRPRQEAGEELVDAVERDVVAPAACSGPAPTRRRRDARWSPAPGAGPRTTGAASADRSGTRRTRSTGRPTASVSHSVAAPRRNQSVVSARLRQRAARVGGYSPSLVALLATAAVAQRCTSPMCSTRSLIVQPGQVGTGASRPASSAAAANSVGLRRDHREIVVEIHQSVPLCHRRVRSVDTCPLPCGHDCGRPPSITLEEFETEARDFLDANATQEGSRAQVRVGRGLRQGGDVRGAQPHRRDQRPAARLRVARQEVRRRVRVDHRAGRVRRPRSAGRVREGVQRAGGAVPGAQPGGVHDRLGDGGADDPGPRQRSGQAELPHQDVPRRHRRLPVVQRARRRQRPGQPADQGRAATATSGSSPGRRCGPPARTTATSARSSPAPTSTCPSTRA